jgi:uncharacterized protein (UPF0261 family)
MKRVYVVGTADTKGEELAFLSGQIADAGLPVLRVDVGTRTPNVEVDVAAASVAARHPRGAAAVLGTSDRGAAVSAMGEAFANFITMRDDIAGIIGIGGGGGTSIITQPACARCRSGCPRSWCRRSPPATLRLMSTSPTSS